MQVELIATDKPPPFSPPPPPRKSEVAPAEPAIAPKTTKVSDTFGTSLNSTLLFILSGISVVTSLHQKVYTCLPLLQPLRGSFPPLEAQYPQYASKEAILHFRGLRSLPAFRLVADTSPSLPPSSPASLPKTNRSSVAHGSAAIRRTKLPRSRRVRCCQQQPVVTSVIDQLVCGP